jgi:hypothetical protein
MTLLVTIFLVLINIHNTIQTNSPKVSNKKKKIKGVHLRKPTNSLGKTS